MVPGNPASPTDRIDFDGINVGPNLHPDICAYRVVQTVFDPHLWMRETNLESETQEHAVIDTRWKG